MSVSLIFIIFDDLKIGFSHGMSFGQIKSLDVMYVKKKKKWSKDIQTIYIEGFIYSLIIFFSK